MRFPVEVEVLHASYFVTVDVVNVEPANVLPRLVEVEVRTTQLNDIGLHVLHGGLLSLEEDIRTVLDARIITLSIYSRECIP
jgi:glycerol-3-phosphate responsive antiterminator